MDLAETPFNERETQNKFQLDELKTWGENMSVLLEILSLICFALCAVWEFTYVWKRCMCMCRC